LKQSFFSSLIFKVGLIIILIEIVVLASTGIYYIQQFNKEVDARIDNCAKLPGKMMASGILEYKAVREQGLMTELAGNDLIEAMVITVTGRVFYSLNTEFEGRIVSEVPGLSPEWFLPSVTESFLQQAGDNGDKHVSSITPILAGESAKPYYFLYLKISTSRTNQEKQNMANLFIIGSVLCIIITSLVILVSFRIMISKRLSNTLKGLKQIEDGALDTRIDPGTSKDEIAALQRGLNSMTSKLQETVVTLEKEITERIGAEEELTKHREHLEELVSERTGQLEEKTIELEQVNERLKELDHLKSMFLASMSHELRTPLNSIIGFTGILLQGISGPLSDEQKKQLTMVKGSGQHLLDLINDLLDVSKIEAGKVEVFVEEFALAAVANEVTAAISPVATNKELDVVTKLQDDIVLLSDRRRVKQVLTNLVSNAVKFTDQGQVTITGRRLDNDQVEFEVGDTGIGMKQEDIQRLFQPFQQIDESLTKEHGGTGLGLYLCRKILDLLHGEIRVESEYGTGTTFTVTLPLQHESETRGDE